MEVPIRRLGSGLALPRRTGLRGALTPGLVGSAVLLLAGPGCEAAGPPAPQAAVRDSAGVRIVTSARPEGVTPGWRVESEPFLSLGVVDGDAVREFTMIQGALRLPGGTVVVADGLAQELRYFDADGAHRATAGGRGEGPGEFQALGGILLHPSGSVMAADPFAGRVAVFDGDGALEWTWSPVSDERFPPVPGAALSGDRYLAWVDRWPSTWEEGFGHLALERSLFVYGDRDSPAREIALVPGRDAFIHFDGQIVSNLHLPFGKEPRLAVRGSHIFEGNGERWEIRVREADGSVREILRQERDPRRVTSEMIQADREAFATRFTNEEQRRHALERQEHARVPDRTPAYGAFLVDSRGVLWVEEYRPAWEEGDRRWLAFDAEGVPAALVVFPTDLEVRQIGDDFVLGTATDELGVEQVRLHRLIRDGAP